MNERLKEMKYEVRELEFYRFEFKVDEKIGLRY